MSLHIWKAVCSHRTGPTMGESRSQPMLCLNVAELEARVSGESAGHLLAGTWKSI